MHQMTIACITFPGAIFVLRQVHRLVRLTLCCGTNTSGRYAYSCLRCLVSKWTKYIVCRAVEAICDDPRVSQISALSLHKDAISLQLSTPHYPGAIHPFLQHFLAVKNSCWWQGNAAKEQVHPSARRRPPRFKMWCTH